MAAGTVLYVVFFEILFRERERRREALGSNRFAGFIQLLAIVVGAVAMGCLIGYTHDHDHGHDDHDHDHSHEHFDNPTAHTISKKLMFEANNVFGLLK